MSIFPGPQPGGGSASGPVAVGDIDATGTPSASTYLRGDGTWETPAGEPWVLQSQASNGTTLTLSGLSSGLYEFEAYIISNSASSLMDIVLNGSANSYTYYEQYNGIATSGVALGYFAAGLAGSGSVTVITGRAFANGAIVGAQLIAATTGVGVAQSLIYKTLAESTVTSITVKSDQAAGIGAGSYIRARKIN